MKPPVADEDQPRTRRSRSLSTPEEQATFEDWLAGVESNLDAYTPAFQDWVIRRRS